MGLERLSIFGYRGFASEQTVDFAQPTGQLGSGITVLVGPNNAGKSSIVEALSFALRSGTVPQFSARNRNAATAGQLRIRYDTTMGTGLLATPEEGAATASPRWAEPIRLAHPGQLVVLPSRRRFPAFFGAGTLSRADYAQTDDPSQRGIDQHNFPSRLASLSGDALRAFNQVVGRVLGYTPRWHIEQAAESQNRYVSYAVNSGAHSSEGLGDGLIAVLFVASALCDSQPDDIIVIDEPELSLHPQYQKRLAGVLGEYAKDRQIIYATHSPYFIDWQYLLAGGRLARISSGTAGTVIHNLAPRTVEPLRPLLNDRSNARLLGIEAREIFFLEDRIVLVEGQEDVLLYPEVARQVRVRIAGTFYGWGVGGASNMGTIARVLSDLGFEKVGGLLDKGKEHVVATLTDRFPDYLFQCIPASDVRTKRVAAILADGKPAVREIRGLLDATGLIRRDLYIQVATVLTRLNHALTETKPVGNGGIRAEGIVVNIPADAQLGEPLGDEPDADRAR